MGRSEGTAIRASLPWAHSKPKYTKERKLEGERIIPIATYDSQERIQKCLRCELVECRNCYSNSYVRKGYRHKFGPEERNALEKMILQGLTYSKINQVLPISRTRFYELRKEILAK